MWRIFWAIFMVKYKIFWKPQFFFNTGCQMYSENVDIIVFVYFVFHKTKMSHSWRRRASSSHDDATNMFDRWTKLFLLQPFSTHNYVHLIQMRYICFYQQTNNTNKQTNKQTNKPVFQNSKPSRKCIRAFLYFRLTKVFFLATLPWKLLFPEYSSNCLRIIPNTRSSRTKI